MQNCRCFCPAQIQRHSSPLKCATARYTPARIEDYSGSSLFYKIEKEIEDRRQRIQALQLEFDQRRHTCTPLCCQMRCSYH